MPPTTQPRTASAQLRARVLLLTLTLLVSGAMAAPAAHAAGGTPTGRAWLRAAHLVPGLGAARIDLTPQGSGSGTAIEMTPQARYGDVTGYQQVAPGSYVVTVRPSGEAATATPMLSRSLTVQPDRAYTLAALGTQASPRLATLVDDLTAPARDHGRVRVLPAASTAPSVTVTAEGGPTIVTGAVLGEATRYASVPAGAWHLRASTGAGGDATDTVHVASGGVYTLLVLDGAQQGSQPRLHLITDAAGASAAPSGGAATGGGGTATDVVGEGHTGAAGQAWLLALIPVLLVAAVTGRGVRRRHVR